MAGRSFTIAFTLLFLCLSFPLFHALEDDTDLSDGVQTLKVGMIRDLYLRYADQDSTIYRGVVYWVNYVNSQGGFPYPLFLMSGPWRESASGMERRRRWIFGKKKKKRLFLIKRRWGNKTLRIDPVITKEASTPDPKQLNNSIANAYPHSHNFTNRNYKTKKENINLPIFYPESLLSNFILSFPLLKYYDLLSFLVTCYAACTAWLWTMELTYLLALPLMNVLTIVSWYVLHIIDRKHCWSFAFCSLIIYNFLHDYCSL